MIDWYDSDGFELLYLDINKAAILFKDSLIALSEKSNCFSSKASHLNRLSTALLVKPNPNSSLTTVLL